jgi:phosphoribosyl 1,2-cyclic phosphate phosphodiesterase
VGGGVREGRAVRLAVTGSGGALRIPNATCACAVCREARSRGAPYRRLGQSLYSRDMGALFDAPEDINEAINALSIPRVDAIFLTHWHPDHTAGLRIIEALRAAAPDRAIEVFLPPGGLDFSINGNSLLDWFTRSGYCSCRDLTAPIERGGVTVTPVTLDNGFVYAFALDSRGARVVHAPCHAKYLPDHPDLRDADVLILGLGTPRGAEPGKTSFADNLRAIETLRPRRAVLTHIEEEWKMNHDELVAFVADHPKIEIAFDGMELTV